MELERYRTLFYAGAAPNKQHFTSYVHFLSMVQMLTVPFPWNWDIPKWDTRQRMDRNYDIGQRPTQMCGN